MHRFWADFTAPLIETLQPKRLLEIGAEFGWNTGPVLAYCRRAGAHLDVVDTVPLQSLRDALAPYSEAEVSLHVAKSIDVIPRLEPVDFVLLDGDHNWRTVYEELRLLFVSAETAGRAPPVVVAHDCAWPYARRDMYYSPDDWTENDRKPYAYRGIRPGVAELVDNGLNARFANALVEGGPENGVLTAIEDFVASHGRLTLKVLPFHNGLGILVPDERRTPELEALLERFFGEESLMRVCRHLEQDGMLLRIDLAEQEKLLTRRTEALQRAREMLKARAARIAELEARLTAASQPA